jgi:hypothetical protein
MTSGFNSLPPANALINLLICTLQPPGIRIPALEIFFIDAFNFPYSNVYKNNLRNQPNFIVSLHFTNNVSDIYA